MLATLVKPMPCKGRRIIGQVIEDNVKKIFLAYQQGYVRPVLESLDSWERRQWLRLVTEFGSLVQHGKGMYRGFYRGNRMGGGVPAAGTSCTTLVQSKTNADSYWVIGDTAAHQVTGISVVASESFSLCKLTVALYAYGTTVGTVTADIYSATGNDPNALIQTADATFDCTGLAGAPTKTDATFTFTPVVPLTNGTRYFIVLTSSTVDASNFPVWHHGADASQYGYYSPAVISWTYTGTGQGDHKLYK